MSAEDFVQPVAPSAFGKQRRADWLAGLQRNADAMTMAAVEAHRADHNVITSGQHGIFGPNDSPQEMGAEVAARQATVGTGWGQGRPLERNGGRYDHHVSAPHPAQRDLRHVGQVQPPSESAVSPLMAYMRGQQ